MSHITPDLIRSALLRIPANPPRDSWAKMAMAIKSELPDATGFDLFSEWSRGDVDGYDAKAVRATWRSVKPSGGVTVTILLQLAQGHGFELPKASGPDAPPDPAELERQRQQRAAREQAGREAQQQAQAAAMHARALWDAASPATPDHGYLRRKGVAPHGLRVGADGRLLMPLRDAEGVLWDVQRIAPAPPADGDPEKLFLKDGRVAGLWHLLGDLAGADVVLVAEGYATAASVHQATDRPVAVAFNAGNLKAVAKAMRQQAPGALVVLCGDDDADTRRRTGKNPGADAAESAARAVHGVAVLPLGLPAGGSDFNDLHQHAGLETVRAQIEAAIDAHRDTKPTASASKPGKPAHGPESLDRFRLTDDGVFYVGLDKDGRPLAKQWLCGPLEVTARTRDTDQYNWGFLLLFATPCGQPREWAMPGRMLAGDGGEYRAALLGMGLAITTNAQGRNRLTEYLQTRSPQAQPVPSAAVGTTRQKAVWPSCYPAKP